MTRRRVIVIAALLTTPLWLSLILWALLQWRQDISAWPHWPDALGGNSAESAPSPSLSITWLGTSTLLISDGETALITDAYFSRVSKLATVATKLAPNSMRIEQMLERYQIDSLDAVMVVHSHYDHALDSPLVAMRTGAELVGSQSTANWGRGAGMDEAAIRVVTVKEPIHYGQFEVVFLLSDHVPQAALIDHLTGIDEQISEPLVAPAPVSAWKEGESYSVIIRHPAGNVLIQGSAGYVEGQLDGYQADVAFISSAGLFRQREGYVADYARNTVAATGAKKVVPIHWDDFFLPWQEEATPALPRLMENLEQSFTLLAQEVRGSDAEFLVMRPGQTIRLSVPAK